MHISMKLYIVRNQNASPLMVTPWEGASALETQHLPYRNGFPFPDPKNVPYSIK